MKSLKLRMLEVVKQDFEPRWKQGPLGEYCSMNSKTDKSLFTNTFTFKDVIKLNRLPWHTDFSLYAILKTEVVDSGFQYLYGGRKIYHRKGEIVYHLVPNTR